MHTSTRLNSTDFQYWQNEAGVQKKATFDDCFPNYHVYDRVGVVSPCLEDGVIHTGHALLALTTAFYDFHRSQSADFFTYPQHFVFVGQDDEGIQTREGPASPELETVWHAWSWLDVWPSSKWIVGHLTASAMLKNVLDYQITRLFWPKELKPDSNDAKLPAYALKLLKSDLHSVYLYSSSRNELEVSGNWIGISGETAVETLIQESINKLPIKISQSYKQPASQTQWFQAVAVNQFLASMAPCFAAA